MPRMLPSFARRSKCVGNGFLALAFPLQLFDPVLYA